MSSTLFCCGFFLLLRMTCLLLSISFLVSVSFSHEVVFLISCSALFEALSTERRFLTGSDISFSMGEEPMQSFSFPTQSFSYPVQSFSFSFGPGDDLSSSFSGNGSVSDASGAATSDPQSTLTNGLTSNDAGRGSETGGNAFADDGDDGGSASTNALLFGILGAVAILFLFGMLINEITKCSRVSLNDADTTLANAPASPVSMV